MQEQNGSHGEGGIEALFSMVTHEPETTPDDLPEEAFDDLKSKLRDYWAEERLHLLNQIKRLVEMRHMEGVKIAKARLRLAEEQLRALGISHDTGFLKG